MDVLVYSSSTPAAALADDDPELDEQHWAYMDRYVDAMTARGPTLGADRQTWTGSLHVVDLPGPDAARDFVAREPYNQAGLFAAHRTWRFVNLLGRTMWQFDGDGDEGRFLVIAHRAEDAPDTLRPVALADLPAQLRKRLVLYGELRDLVDDEPAGVALAVQAPTRDALDVLLADASPELTRGGHLEIHDWEFGGRR